MSQGEAWLITILGMAVVFIGLVLCITFINLFNRLAQHITWDGAHGSHEPHPAPAPAAAATEPLAPATPETIPPDVLAVIAATLEIERRLYGARPGQRLTITR